MASNDQSSLPGGPVDTKNSILETGAVATQTFGPTKSICAHLNAWHVYASDPTRAVEANHYCAHISKDVRQCLLYDSPEPNARLLGVEYMISPSIYASLPSEERRFWHSHVFEVKSGMLVMPNSNVPSTLWDVAETKEMEEVIELYGKTYHLWQVDRGDAIPLGEPQLMMSFTSEEQVEKLNKSGGMKPSVQERNTRLGIDGEQKKDLRKNIKSPTIRPDADSMWK